MPQSPAPSPSSERTVQGLALGLVVLAFLIRLLGVGWGLPNALHNQSYHPDELVIWSYAQQIEPSKLHFDPGFYNYGTLYLTLLRVASDVVSAYSGAEGWAAIGQMHLAGRLLSVLFGAGTVWFVFQMLRRRTHLFGAALGAAALTLAPGHVVHSRFQTVDVTAGFFLAGALYFALELFRPLRSEDAPEGRIRSDLWLAVASGAFAGLSAGTKYTGILALLALFVALGFERRPGWLRLAGIGTLASLSVFVLVTPGALLNTGKFLTDVRFEMLHTSTGHGLVFAGYPSGFLVHAFNLAVGFGAVMAVMGAVGLAGAAWRRRGWALALLGFAAPYAVLIGRADVLFLRYTFPLMIVLAVGFGAFVGWAHQRRGYAMAWVALGILGVGGLDGAGARGTAVMTAWMMGADPRDEAALELEKATKGQPDERVGVPSDPWFYTVPLYPDTGLPRSVPFAKRDEARRAAVEPQVVQFVPEDPDQRFDWDVRLLTEIAPEYVVFSSFEWNDVGRLQGMTGLDPVVRLQVERAAAFRKELERRYKLERVYGWPTVPVHDLQYIRPTVWVWKRTS
ncbi:MAG: glycosyltransferase family 39 protein [Fimbriimonadaceae bacterium]|nr:glycosyltransferase family 39 protein [Fimbriimonadaceae bacterium]